jgi:hypothetical protein
MTVFLLKEPVYRFKITFLQKFIIDHKCRVTPNFLI